MLDLIASGRISIRPIQTHPKTTVIEIDLEHLATTIKNRLNLIFPFFQKLRDCYPNSDTSITDSIVDDVSMMVDAAMAVTYNRLRHVIQLFEPDAFAARMNPRSPFSNRAKFPAFVSAVLSSIGPLRITNGPVDMTVVYATSAARSQTYGRAERFDLVTGRYLSFIDTLAAVGVPLAPIDVKVADRGGSFFSTVIPNHENGVWDFITPFHYSHYEPKDIVSAWLTVDANPAFRAFQDCSMTVGCCTDLAVIEALAGGDVEAATAPVQMVGGCFPVNVYGIRPAVAAEGRNPAVPAGVYMVGRGSERYYCTSLARHICDWEMLSMLHYYIFNPPKGGTSF